MKSSCLLTLPSERVTHNLLLYGTGGPALVNWLKKGTEYRDRVQAGVNIESLLEVETKFPVFVCS